MVAAAAPDAVDIGPAEADNGSVAVLRVAVVGGVLATTVAEMIVAVVADTGCLV